MGGVDACDKYVSYCKSPHHHRRWYLTLFHQLLEIGIMNARVVYQKATTRDPTLLEFRKELINVLLRKANWALGVPESGPSAAAHSIQGHTRLTGRHFTLQYLDSGKPDCAVCSGRSKGHRRQTAWHCEDFKVPMCPGIYFKCYPTLLNYKLHRMPPI